MLPAVIRRRYSITQSFFVRIFKFASGAMTSTTPAHQAATVALSNKPMWGIALLVLAMWTLSGLDATGKWVMSVGVPLLLLSWMRYAVHVLLVLAVVVPWKGRQVLRSQHPTMQIVRGMAMLSGTLFFFTTLSYLPQAEATAINFLAPMIVLSLSPWLLGEPPRRSSWIAAVVAFFGVLIVIRPSGGLDPVGVMFGLLTAASMSIQFIATRKLAGDSPFTTLIWGGVVGTMCTTLVLPIFGPGLVQAVEAMQWQQWLLLCLAGVFGCLGHLLQIGAYKYAAASMLAPFLYLQIISATAVGWLLWGDFPDALTWLGIFIICISGAGIGWMEWKRSR